MKINVIKGKKQRKRKESKRNQFCIKSLRMLGVNAAGIKSKLTSFKNILNELKPAVFFIEETKQKDEGKLKFENYDVFEHVRDNRKGGGGLALGCLKDLQAVYVRGGDQEVEALSVDIFVKNFKIRCCVAYGCQESDLEKRKDSFWDYLAEEVSLAEQAEAGFILHMDGNLWAGDKIIPGDPRNQNRNGKIFQKILEEHQNLTVVNSLPQCEGLITRARNKDGKIEESVLDFFIVCNRVLPYVRKMKIDTNKKHVLTNYARVRIDGKTTESDHFTQYIDLDLEIDGIRKEKREILNFKNEEGQKKFRKLTSENERFSKCFKTNAPLHKLKNNIASKEHDCDECNYKYKGETEMNVHLRKDHMDISKSHCNKCEEKFNNRKT